MDIQVMNSNWKIFLDEVTKDKELSVNSMRILLNLPDPEDYSSLIYSGLESLNKYLIESIREKYYREPTDELLDERFSKHKTELFKSELYKSLEIKEGGNDKLDKLYQKLREEYTKYCNRSSAFAYENAVRKATSRIWICQTWLPGTERDAGEITKREVANTRILLLSFKVDLDSTPPIYSPIYARISGRKLNPEGAQLYSARSVKPFFEEQVKYSKQGVDVSNIIRFSYGHYPGWIAIIDDFVFCGFTPVDLESHNKDFLFHKYSIGTSEGKFWEKQFELLWKEYSHPFEQEKQYNPKLNFG
jgi:hypothetical protein